MGACSIFIPHEICRSVTSLGATYQGQQDDLTRTISVYDHSARWYYITQRGGCKVCLMLLHVVIKQIWTKTKLIKSFHPYYTRIRSGYISYDRQFECDETSKDAIHFQAMFSPSLGCFICWGNIGSFERERSASSGGRSTVAMCDLPGKADGNVGRV